MKAITKKESVVLPEIQVSNTIPDVSNDPVFLQKKQKAVAFLKRHPAPKNMLPLQK
ncbi:hypothetical protein [Dyadobacter sp. LHD-138]|uniref:hypothetical protein n=1 Tax=Dyadobacter sp. LHD-138 TaxID=3071413 RepID=UPI0027DFA72A|nr:hypothetical protein [Dyadobacter sp. LHD-138]MDQ6477613.1 hypothetical protein [Dyadobacter sp. LHD-138]